MSKPEPVRAGVYQAVDKDQLAAARLQYGNLLKENSERGKKWLEHAQEYTTLKEKLSTLSDEATRSAMIPMGSKAFMMGHLVHTNEITVLLGDNWFAERSAKQAGEICQRRLDHCNDLVKKLCEERRLAEGWLREAEQLGGDSLRGDGNLEIREPFDEETESEWREKHKQRQKAEKPNQATVKEVDDEELWRRLDELEMQEELDAHLENQEEEEEEEEEIDDNESGNGSSDLSESPPLTDDEEEEEEQEPPTKESLLKRRVSFGATTASTDQEQEQVNEGNNEPLCLIEFLHSKWDSSSPRREEVASNDPMAPPVDRAWLQSPSDLGEPAAVEEDEAKNKGILKPFSERDLRVWPEARVEKKAEEVVKAPPRTTFVDPVGSVVVEKRVEEMEVAEEPVPKKVSKFKQARMNRR